ncbi:MAG TPA: glucose-1-phosphate adenylyltransferase [Anaerolineae bacterium]|nr:glucose-1-phosphate adenylyltransferase [Anaerolineae bacterium]HXK41823.1 glucose-1-phosphate adenylyltransferase [Anaerolineae bacterium]
MRFSVQDVVSVILGGGAGTRLYPLTKVRAKPAVPLAGHYRLIDVPISNCIHSGIDRIYVLTQFNSESLHRHITRTYVFDNFSTGSVRILAAEQTPSSSSWYQGTADALRKQLFQLQASRSKETLILSGDHLYRMDYSDFVAAHRDANADITIAVHPVSPEEAPEFGILQADAESRIVRFVEKPAPDHLKGLESYTGDKPYTASMGIYVFRSQLLYDMLRQESGSDFGKHLIPAAIEQGLNVRAYRFDDYWEDIGTIEAYYKANLALTTSNPPFDFFDADWPIYTRPRYLPGSRIIDSDMQQVFIAPGCIVDQSTIRSSVVGLRSVLCPGAHLHRVVMMGADYYETETERAENRRLGIPDVGVGEGSVIEGAILDKNVRIGRNVVIRSHAGEPDSETKSYVIRDGIVVIPKDTVVPDGTII